MQTDRERWDAKYIELAGPLPGPDAFVQSALDELGPGHGRPALDLAAGRGRHALELARRGWAAHAWDVSPVGLARCVEYASAEGLGVATRAVDLLAAETGGEELRAAFALVVVVNFLDRSLWARLHRLVCPGGSLIVTTYTEDWPRAKPSRRFRLERGELARGIEGFVPLRALEHGGRAGLLARRVDVPDQPGSRMHTS